MSYSPDATKHTEVDPNGRFVVSSSQITTTTIPRNEDAYVYRSYGSGYWTDISGGVAVTDANGLQFTVDPDSAVADSSISVWALTNEVNDWRYFVSNNLPLVSVLLGVTSGGAVVISPFYINTSDTVVNLGSHNAGGQNTRYVSLTFGSGNIAVKMWSDSGRTNLVYDISASDMKSVSFEYEYLTQSDNVGTAPTISCKSQDWVYTDRNDPFVLSAHQGSNFVELQQVW